MKRTKVSSVSSTKGSRWRQHQVSAGSAGSDLERVDVADANEARVVQNKVVEIEPEFKEMKIFVNRHDQDGALQSRTTERRRPNVDN